jgi:hypothetical protein
MVYFQTKNPDLGKFWRAFDWKLFVYFVTIWHILRRIGIMYIHMSVWYILWSFGIFFPFWYVWTKKNLATLFSTPSPDFFLLEIEYQMWQRCNED